MCEKRLIKKHGLKEGIISGLTQANPQNEIDAKLKQFVYDIPVENDNPGVRDTCFLFIMEDTGKPVPGLRIFIGTKDGGVLKGTTNNKGYVVVPFDKEAPYRLLNINHPDNTGSGKSLDAADVIIESTYKNSLNYAGKEQKDLSYIKSWKETSDIETEDTFMPIKQIEIQSGDTLKSLIETEYPQLKTHKNRANFIYEFNWNTSVKNTLYRFDFGQDNKIYLPLYLKSYDGFEKNKTHIIKLKKEKEIVPLAQKILDSDLEIIKRENWSGMSLNRYNILDPGIIESNRSVLQFDCKYDTIVLHHSGDTLEPTVDAVENHHLKESYEDIAYHYIIGRAEKRQSHIYEGRPLIFKGAASRVQNEKKIGILIAGDFVDQWWDRDDEIEQSQIILLKKLLKKLKKEIPTINKLIGNCDLTGENPSSASPGRLHEYLPYLRIASGIK